MDEYASPCLSSHYQHDAHKIWCEARPWCIIDGEYRSIDKGLDFIKILCGNENIVTPKLHLNAQLWKTAGCCQDWEWRFLIVISDCVIAASPINCQSQSYPAGWYGVVPPSFLPFDGQQVGANALYFWHPCLPTFCKVVVNRVHRQHCKW